MVPVEGDALLPVDQGNVTPAGGQAHTRPLRLWTDYVYNWDAASDDAHGAQVGLRLGQTKNQGDWSLFGFHQYLGREAAISSLTSSEFGTAGTNVQSPAIGIDYQLLNPLTLSAKRYRF